MKKKIIISLFSLLILLILWLGVSLFIKKDSQYTLVVIPHFMIYPQRVSDFYDFIKNKSFYKEDPDVIVLLSPNHFSPQQKRIEWLNKEENIKYKEYSILWEPVFLENIDYSWNVFYNLWEQKYVKDHGLWEHFRRISQYFPDVKVVPLALPTHDMFVSKNLAEYTRNLKWNVLIIASVDFSHYKSEDIALENDKISYETLANPWNFLSLKKLDVDCPSCLWTLYLLWEGKKLHQWMRDSSSSLVWYDLKEENTSRQFLYRE